MADLANVTVGPLASVPYGVITAIRIQDIARHIWYNWDAPGPWNPSEPIVTVGTGTLYIAFWVTNTGPTGTLFTLTVQESDTAKNLAQIMVNIGAGASAGIEAPNLTMPNKSYGIKLIVVP